MAHAPATQPRDRREPGEVFGPGFTLFADMLLIGLLTALACLPVVTAPAAFAAASATLRQTAGDGLQIKVGTYMGHLRQLLTPRALAAGLLPPVLFVVLLVDVALVRGGMPGAQIMAPALALLTFGAAVVGLRATALEAPHQLSVREALVRSAGDLRGALLLGAAALLAVLIAWSTPLMIPLLPGPLAFAATVVDLRRQPDAQQSRPRQPHPRES
ncbi:hypothetical protein DSC45_04915 [Streptomyces sp. YIM 130001]|uniref:hypothetical protein n=1 Tax=Streptomyces sp. YIM 130001 TaxID=2259644 RepID=UPI000E649B1B|nr:hypothetical protein [Streptomyces sp. YIM 130001]RII20548.1 hypothetical protein DSC45_04915 [Streptomyces sp. YIM 130001]